MDSIFNGRMLRNSAFKRSTSALAFANHLYFDPAIAVCLFVEVSLWCSTGTYLRNDSIQINETKGYSHEAAHLADAIALTVDESKTGHRLIAQFDSDG